MTDTGFCAGGTAAEADNPDGNHSWIDHAQALTQNGIDAYSYITYLTPTEYLKITNFNFNIPAGSTINGITIYIRHITTSTSAMYDQKVMLVRDGVIEGSNKASPTVWVYPDYSNNYYGGETELWGLTWTAEQINSINTGFVISAQYMGGGSRYASIDFVEMRVHYTENLVHVDTINGILMANIDSIGGISTANIAEKLGLA